MDDLDGSRVSASSVVNSSPSQSPGVLHQPHLPCCSPTVPCVSGASDLVSDDEVLFPTCPAPSHRPSAAAALLADSDDEGHIPRFPTCLRVIVITRFLFQALCFLVFPPLPAPLLEPSTCMLVADALLGIFDTDVFPAFRSKPSQSRGIQGLLEGEFGMASGSKILTQVNITNEKGGLE
jgi:hypothetical protein